MFSGGRCQFGAPGGARRPYSAKLAHLEQPIRVLSGIEVDARKISFALT
jgi:hypothetical protein